MGVGTQRDSINWESLDVERRGENKPHGDCASPTEATVGGPEPACHQGKRRTKTRPFETPTPLYPFETYHLLLSEKGSVPVF